MNDYEPTQDEIDAMDDSVHILYPGNTTLTLCGSTTKGNRIGYRDPWPDPMSGCWTCLTEAPKMRELA